MTVLSCPHCDKDATSYLNLGNTLYYFKSKKCDYCGKPIFMSSSSVLIIFFIIPSSLILALWVLFHFSSTQPIDSFSIKNNIVNFRYCYKESTRQMGFFEIFLLAFLVALSGSLSPGPLLTYTIYKAIQSGKRAYLIVILIWIGHAILEFFLMLVLLIGLSPFITDRSVVIIIGLLGGGILIFFGGSLLRDIWLKKIDLNFLSSEKNNIIDQDIGEKTDLIQQPTLGGVLVSMSNPYWWIWWTVIGLNFMTQFSVGILNMEFWGFFLGHELGDFLTYVSIATILGFTNKFFTRKIYLGIIIACSAFMIIFGLYLAVSPILSYSPGANVILH